MRRKDREMPREFALSVADKCEWATIGMVDAEGSPYCIPVTIVREDDHIYFHSAQSGFKTDCLKQCNQVCMACVGDTFRPPNLFTTEFESTVLRGTAAEVTGEAEKIHALELLCRRHSPANMENFDRAVQKSLSRTAVWRIDIQEITGKRKKIAGAG